LKHQFEMDDPEFAALVDEAVQAIDLGVLPTLIPQGSSGSYFVKNTAGKIIAVFKPKDEEPYGELNPKWAKWVQKHCCPCCFGRACLIPNQGYLSEAGAYLVDRKLGLNIVPKTHVVKLASPSFHYAKLDIKKAQMKKAICNSFPSLKRKFHRIGLPHKKGSFQIFVEDYKDSDFWIHRFATTEALPQAMQNKFLYLFQCMVVLDYVIRNTDRGDANWLIKFHKLSQPTTARKTPPSTTAAIIPTTARKSPPSPAAITPSTVDKNVQGNSTDTSASPADNQEFELKLAAIDNGLAFPFKHPDAFRLYPYHWASLPFALIPFSQQIKDLILPKTTDPNFVKSLCEELRVVFMVDKGFNTKQFNKQMGVLKGQLINLNQALQENMSPAQLVELRELYTKGPNDTPIPVKLKMRKNTKKSRFKSFTSIKDSSSSISDVEKDQKKGEKHKETKSDDERRSSSSGSSRHRASSFTTVDAINFFATGQTEPRSSSEKKHSVRILA
jgi:phosphatidylinositol 4-kinase type 2